MVWLFQGLYSCIFVKLIVNDGIFDLICQSPCTIVDSFIFDINDVVVAAWSEGTVDDLKLVRIEEDDIIAIDDLIGDLLSN